MKYFPLWLSAICIILFLIQSTFLPFTDSLILNQDSFVQPYRFVTSIFLHANLSHLVFNLFALLLFGFILEKIIGSKKFLLVFFASGIIANLISVNFYDSSLGASGAIYGILGCLTILRPKMSVWVYNMPMPMFLASIIWVFISIAGVFTPSNTGHIAHLSGIAVGFIFGFLYRSRFKEQRVIKQRISLPEDYMRNWEDRFLR